MVAQGRDLEPVDRLAGISALLDEITDKVGEIDHVIAFDCVLNRIDAADDWNRYGWTLPVAAVALLAVIYVTAPQTRTVAAGHAVADTQALAIAQRHCMSCHAKNPSHPAFTAPPKNVVLETVDDLRRYGEPIVLQTVQNRAMPLGNLTGMTDEERDQLGRWLRAAR